MTGYLDWQSSLNLEEVFADGTSFSYPQLLPDGSGRLVYLSTLKEEQGRVALMLLDNGNQTCVTPAPYHLRTKVNEYGGKPYWLVDQSIVFANQEDQCLYRQMINSQGLSEPQRLTEDAGDVINMYTDVLAAGKSALICIAEQESTGQPDSDNRMFIASLQIDGTDAKPEVLVQGADFYSNLVVSADRQKVAWVEWNHPQMPWDENQLCVAELQYNDSKPQIVNRRHVPLATGASVCQLLFADNGKLFFSADFPGQTGAGDFWNLHAYEPDSGRVVRVTDELLEFGYPHWVYGDHRIVQLESSSLLTIGSAAEQDFLFRIDCDNYAVTKVACDPANFQQLNADGKGNFAAIVFEKMARPKMVRAAINNDSMVIRSKLQDDKLLADVSVAEHISFSTADGSSAYAFYYPPRNTEFEQITDADEQPPLIIMVHGGPTARAYGYFDIQKQFWTSRGFAILDVNHRGSSGYGRSYRDSLYRHWGELDARDIIDAIEAVVAAGKADPNRICIRGKSAGGYAVLRALTEYPEYFKAGACYYGIGNLVTLAEVTHKFEKFYTDRLIDETFDPQSARQPESRFYQRSPIHKINRVDSAMIVFQGLLDKVVPPAVAREVIDVLKSAHIPHDYVEYADEGHGFRQVNNNIDAWSRELSFYRQHLV